MSRSGDASGRHLVGRSHEQHLLREALRGAADGHPCAVVVTGEAGVGKTRLVRDVVSAEAGAVTTRVLWGTCVQFGASSLPYAPMITALRDVLPSVGTDEPVHLLPVIDAVVNDLARRGPTVLVVDDLQWADVSSLDAVAYLIAGFREQPLAVVVTCRDEPRRAGHPLYGWLADMRRMPAFHEVVVPRLDPDGTAELLARVRGEAIDPELAAQVHARSDGNPYLTELLGRELEPGAQVVPGTASGRLTEALTATWHRLDPTAREVMRTLAVGGRPSELSVLEEVVRRQGIAVTDLGPALASALVEGVLAPVTDGRPWFRHPLLAEVLYAGIPTEQATAVHAAFAEVLATRPASAAADLAAHYERSGNLDRAFECSLAAASSAGTMHALAEQAQHLVRACALWPRVSTSRRGPPAARVDLLREAAGVARLVSRYDDAQRLLEQARSLVDEGADPLLHSRLLSEWGQVNWERSVPGVALLPELFDAVRLTEDFPDSEERALALCCLADAYMWDGDFEAARRTADEGLAVAQRSGSDALLARGLFTWASVQDRRGDEPLRRVQEGLRLSRAIDDAGGIVDGTIWLINLLQERLRLADAAEAGRLAFDEVQRLGGVHWAYFMLAMAADDLLSLGRFEEARGLLREALAIRCVGVPGVATRLVATRLACRTGDLDGARRHLDRALEVADPDFGGLVISLIGTVVELRLAEGDPRAALAWIEQRVDGRWDEDIAHVAMLWAARALANLGGTARDADDAAGRRRAVEELAAWEDRVALSVTPGSIDTPSPDPVVPVLTRAEVARCREDDDEAELWQQAVDVCHETGFRWDEACALVRLIEAQVRRRAPRAVLAPLVRQLHRHAVDMGAGPLLERSEQLARASRVSLVEPSAVREPLDRPGPGGSLTDREREVLAHLVAGRTNGEIARELVISDKTVSVHVSNILRKTGTSSRAEVAAWAVRRT